MKRAIQKQHLKHAYYFNNYYKSFHYMESIMKKTFKLLSVLCLATSASLLSAAPIPIDLTSWESDGDGSWTVQGAGNDSVFQSINGRPTTFFEAGSNAQNTSIAGIISVETTNDDDFIGFVLGYQDGEMLSGTSDFMLIDWKKRDQALGKGGLAISRVLNATRDTEFWEHTGGVTEIARGTNLGNTGWASNQSYNFDIVFQSNLIQVKVNNILELSITAADAGLTAFSDGAAGFYNYSQGSVRYAGITEEQITVSAPATLSLFGILILMSLRLRKRR